jgi:hypothetical protein
VSFECKWNTFPSSTLGIIIFLVNWVLRSILETIRKVVAFYVTFVACWQQVLLGYLGKG